MKRVVPREEEVTTRLRKVLNCKKMGLRVIVWVNSYLFELREGLEKTIEYFKATD